MTDNSSVEVIQLATYDWEEYRRLHLEGLEQMPSAFGKEYSGEINQPKSYWTNRIKNKFVFSAIVGKELAVIVSVAPR